MGMLEKAMMRYIVAGLWTEMGPEEKRILKTILANDRKVTNTWSPKRKKYPITCEDKQNWEEEFLALM